MLKLVLEKAEEPEIKLPASVGLLIKQENSRKTSISALLTMPKPLTMCIMTNYEKFLKRWKYQTTLPAFQNLCSSRRSRTGRETMDCFQIRKGVRQGCILSHCLFNFYKEHLMQNAGPGETQAGIKNAGRYINNFKYTDATTFMT